MTPTSPLDPYGAGGPALDVLTGTLTAVRVHTTRQGRAFGVALVDTGPARLRALVFPANLPRVLATLGDRWRPGTSVRATGRLTAHRRPAALYVTAMTATNDTTGTTTGDAGRFLGLTRVTGSTTTHAPGRDREGQDQG